MAPRRQGVLRRPCAFGTAADAEPLVAYLDRHLRRPDLSYDQCAALGALLLLDSQQATTHAARLLAPAGLWQPWTDGPPKKNHADPDHYRRHIGHLCTAVVEATAHLTAADVNTARDGPPIDPRGSEK